MKKCQVNDSERWREREWNFLIEKFELEIFEIREIISR